MRSRADVLVIADDLSGAADSGVPFSLRGMRTEVLLDGGLSSGAPVVVVDTDSRHLAADAAAASVREAVRAYGSARLIYKKIDSTLRGNVAAELGALPGPVILCPASPATGRTVVDGVVRIDGVPLPATTAWSAEPSPAPETVAAALAPLPVRTIGLPAIRGSRDELRHAIETAISAATESVNGPAKGTTPGAVVCDAVTDADLRAIAQACLDLQVSLSGAAGLAHALATCLPPSAAAASPEAGTAPAVSMPPVTGTALAVVGSANAVSRAQAEHLAGAFPNALRVAPGELLDPASRTALAARIARLTEAGDTVISIADGTGASRSLSAALGEVVAEATRSAGLLVLTGGETARSVLGRLEIGGLELIAEPEPGVVLAKADDTYVLTKAGGFGRAATLDRAIQAVRKGPQ